MKDWEINQVNDLYKRNDALQNENNKLKETDKETGSCSAKDLDVVLKSMEDRLDRFGDRLDQVAGAVQDVLVKLEEIKCKCTEEKPVRQYNKKTK